MSESPATVLQQWARGNKLTEVKLNTEGTSLTLGDVALDAGLKVDISHADKNCEYSLASMFLQILEPGQSLVGYRKVCKEHSVKDPVKASDKVTVLGFFLGGEATAEATVEKKAEEKPAESAPAEAAPVAAEKHKHREDKHRSDKHRDRDRERERHHHKDKHHRHHHKDKRERDKRHRSSSEKPPKQRKSIDTEKLFSNLVTVVDKRSKKDEEQNAALVEMLSPEGFAVTPELLAEYRESTQTLSANEIPVGNSASILKAAAGKDLSRILKLYMETVQKPSAGIKAKSPSANDQGQKKSWRPYLVGKKPVIILPKGMTSPITLLNAHEFFANSRYVPRDVMMKQGAHKTAAPTTFHRRVSQRLGGSLVEYELMDNPKAKLPTARDWERVVAVVALGHAWQFKDWPGHYSNPVRLFGSCFGFFVGGEGDKLPAELQGWSVVKCTLSRDKRGLDSVTYAKFWNGLDEYMAVHKPEMLPQPET